MLSAIAIGCAARVPSPEPLPLDRVECAHCGMLISSERGSGEVVSVDGDTRFYDDIACLAADWAAHAQAARGARAFVRVPGGAWAEATAAAYARPGSARTAMGSGLAAFASAGDAQAADESGRALTFDEVLRLSGEKR
jgi:nitrous oxide reductase accessory protein NosL